MTIESDPVEIIKSLYKNSDLKREISQERIRHYWAERDAEKALSIRLRKHRAKLEARRMGKREGT